MKMEKIAIELAEMQNENISDNIMYSLVLRLRQIYIVDCLIKNKIPRKKELLNLIKKISGSLKSYWGYLRIKNNEKDKNELPIEESKKLYNYLVKKIREQEIWVKTKS